MRVTQSPVYEVMIDISMDPFRVLISEASLDALRSYAVISMMHDACRTPNVNLDRPYNAHTRRIITAASMNAIDFVGMKLESPYSAVLVKMRAVQALRRKRSTSPVMMLEVSMGNIENGTAVQLSSAVNSLGLSSISERMKHEHIRLSVVNYFLGIFAEHL